MSIASISVRKKVTVVMVTGGVFLLGIISFLRLPQELFPPIVFPQITVVTEYANAAPEEIETLITKPIEESIGSVTGLKRVDSISREGRSTVIISFNWGQDIDFAALAVREKIDLVKERLPKESEDPVVLKFDPLARPVLMLSVKGANIPPVQLKYLATKMLKDNLEKLEGVASVAVSGGADREILVNIDQARLEANHLSLLEVIQSIENANVTYPAGSIKKGLYEYLIRTVGEFRTVKEIGFTVAGVDMVKQTQRPDTSFLEKGDQGPRQTLDTMRGERDQSIAEKRLVLVRDIAEIVDGTGEQTSISRYNGSENITLAIQKQANANTIQVVDRVRKALDFLKEDIESRGISYEIIYDHSIFIRASLENLVEEFKGGGILVFFVLFAFLRSIGPPLLVLLSIPISIFGTFFCMGLAGITLNTMSTGGLVLAIGMIGDTSIVVLENIFRYRQQHPEKSPDDAAIEATEEVLWPVVTSNLTTIAVFFPMIAFVPGIPGQIFKDLSWAIIFSQIVSTVVPITVVPMLSVYLKVQSTEYNPLAWTKPLEKQLIGDHISIGRRIAFSGMMLVAVFALCSTALPIFASLEKEVLPKVDQGQFLIKVDMHIGTRLEITDRVCKRIENAMSDLKEIESVAVTIGSEKSSKGEIKVESLRSSQALILVVLKDGPKGQTARVVGDLQKKITALDLEGGEVDFVLQESEFAFAEGGAKPILIEVKGYDFEEMSHLVEEVKKQLRQIPGVINPTDDMGESSPETKLEIDKKRAALYGISALDISLITKAAIDGVVSTQYREAGKEFDIRVRLSEKDRSNVENLNNMLLYSKVLNALIPLKEVASIEKGSGPSEIKRSDQERTIMVSADIDQTMKSKDVLVGVQEMLQKLQIPQDFRVLLSGKAKEVKENFNKVTFAFVLALVLNYMIMASQFESFVQPIIIMFTVPLALFGTALALLFTGTSLNVISLLGMIFLAGTAVNNGIVLIEYMNQAREEGQDVEEAALNAAKIRTRPILMSALTSAIGLAPMALGLGESAELRAPMAVSMFGGTIAAVFLSLIVIPMFYIFVTRVTEKVFGSAFQDDDDPDDIESEPVPPPKS